MKTYVNFYTTLHGEIMHPCHAEVEMSPEGILLEVHSWYDAYGSIYPEDMLTDFALKAIEEALEEKDWRQYEIQSRR